MAGGDIAVTLRLIDEFSGPLASAESAITGVGQRIGSGLTSSIGGALAQFGLMALGVQQLGQTLGGLSDTLFGYNARMEQSMTAMTGLLGSAQAARAELANLQTMAAATPFEMPQLVTAATRLIGVGVAAKDTIPWLTAIGDAVYGLGGGAPEIDRATLALTQMLSTGTIHAQDMLQLTQLNINAWGELSKATGKSVADLQAMSQAGQLLSSQYVPLLVRQLGTDFQGQMAAASHTFNGLVSTLKDNLNIALGQVTQGSFKVVEDELAKLVNYTQSPAFTASAQHFGDELTRAFERGAEFVDREGPGLAHTFEDAAAAALKIGGVMAEVAVEAGKVNDLLGGHGFEALAAFYVASKIPGAGALLGKGAGALGDLLFGGAESTVAGGAGGLARELGTLSVNAGTVIVNAGEVIGGKGLPGGVPGGKGLPGTPPGAGSTLPEGVPAIGEVLGISEGAAGLAGTALGVAAFIGATAAIEAISPAQGGRSVYGGYNYADAASYQQYAYQFALGQRAGMQGPPIPFGYTPPAPPTGVAGINQQIDLAQQQADAAAQLIAQQAANQQRIAAINQQIDLAQQRNEAAAQQAALEQRNQSFRNQQNQLIDQGQTLAEASPTLAMPGVFTFQITQQAIDQASTLAQGPIADYNNRLNAAQQALDMLNQKRAQGLPLSAQEQAQYQALTWAVQRYGNGIRDDLNPSYIAAQANAAEFTRAQDELTQKLQAGQITQQQYNQAIIAANSAAANAGAAGGDAGAAGLASLKQFEDQLNALPAEKTVNIDANTQGAEHGLSTVNQQVDSVPDQKDVTVDANTAAAQAHLQQVNQDIDGIPEQHTTLLEANATPAQQHIQQVNQDIDGIPEEHQTTLNADPTPAQSHIRQVNQDIDGIPASHNTVVTADVGPAEEAVSGLKAMIESGAILPVNVVTGTVGGQAAFAAGGTASHTMIARVGELGPELAIFPYAGAFAAGGTVGLLGNGYALLPTGTQVIPADQTQQMLNASQIISAMSEGLASGARSLPELLDRLDQYVRQYGNSILQDVVDLANNLQSQLDAAWAKGDTKQQETIQGQLDAVHQLMDAYAGQAGASMQVILNQAANSDKVKSTIIGNWDETLKEWDQIVNGQYLSQTRADLAQAKAELAALGQDAPKEVVDALNQRIATDTANIATVQRLLDSPAMQAYLGQQRTQSAEEAAVSNLPGILSGQYTAQLQQQIDTLTQQVALATAEHLSQDFIDSLQRQLDTARADLIAANRAANAAVERGLVPAGPTALQTSIAGQLGQLNSILSPDTLTREQDKLQQDQQALKLGQALGLTTDELKQLQKAVDDDTAALKATQAIQAEAARQGIVGPQGQYGMVNVPGVGLVDPGLYAAYQATHSGAPPSGIAPGSGYAPPSINLSVTVNLAGTTVTDSIGQAQFAQDQSRPVAGAGAV